METCILHIQHEHFLFRSAAGVSPNVPRTGKINRVGVSVEGHDLILPSSSQQPIKSFKGSSQIVMVTKPAAASSADSHISLVVRARLFLLLRTKYPDKKSRFLIRNRTFVFFSSASFCY